MLPFYAYQRLPSARKASGIVHHLQIRIRKSGALVITRSWTEGVSKGSFNCSDWPQILSRRSSS